MAYNHAEDYENAVWAAEGPTVPIFRWAKEKAESGFYKNPRNTPDYSGLEFDNQLYSKEYQDGYTLVGQDRHYNGGSDLVWKRTKRPSPPPAAPAPEPKPPVIEAKPAPSFDAAPWSKPSAPAAEKPRYQLNTEASGYQKWLAENRPGSHLDSGSAIAAGGDRRMAGGRQFRERLNRYRS